MRSPSGINSHDLYGAYQSRSSRSQRFLEMRPKPFYLVPFHPCPFSAMQDCVSSQRAYPLSLLQLGCKSLLRRLEEYSTMHISSNFPRTTYLLHNEHCPDLQV